MSVVLEDTVLFCAIIGFLWVKNFLLPMKDVRERAARNLETGLKSTSVTIPLIHCMGAELNESGLAAAQESHNSI